MDRSRSKRSRKLLIFTDTDVSQVNGVQLSIENLRSNLDSSVQIKIASPDDFLHFPLPYYREIHLSIVFPVSIRKLLRNYRPDYVHIATEGPIGFVAAKTCKDLWIPYTSAFHTKFPEYIRLRSKYIPGSYVHTYLKYIHNGSRKILISNDSMRKYLESNSYHRIQVVPFGIDHSIFSPGEKKLFRDLPKPILLYVGRLAIEKNVEDFLRIPTAGSKLVAGDGPLRKKLELNYPETLFLGYKDKLELAEIYRSADLFVLPSKTDTLGLVNLEAMACGLPVLAYDVDGPRGVIKTGLTGILIPENDKLENGVEAALRIKPENCTHAASAYTWQSYAKDFMNHQTSIPKSQWT